jgi:hypothetical protein
MLSEHHTTLLHLVKEFSGIKRYCGVMPKRLAEIFDDDLVRKIIDEKYAALISVKMNGLIEVQGMVLTDKGERFLQEYAV